jgi:hypothetical protein
MIFKAYARMTDPTMADPIIKGHKCILNHAMTNGSGRNAYTNGLLRVCNHCMCVHLQTLDEAEPVLSCFKNTALVPT